MILHIVVMALPFQCVNFLGVELQNRHRLQICTPGGMWKHGCILVKEQRGDNVDKEKPESGVMNVH